MMDKYESRKDNESDGGEEVFSKVIRAGRRTYFLDVKATRGDDYYLTITESRKKQARDGSFSFEKNKLYLYKEDFNKFVDGLDEVVNFIKTSKPEFFAEEALNKNANSEDL